MAGKEVSGESAGEVSKAETQRLERAALVERLVAGGASRLTAERMAAIEQGDEERGRARPHRPQARR